MFSVVIPAYNESAVIARCLETLLADRAPDEFEVIVVANGCHDDTAEIARSFGPPVTVIETQVPSKTNALNLGDRAATGFPRMYIDADIDVTVDALRAVAEVLSEPTPYVVAAPRGVVAFDACTSLVRSFMRVWSSLPFFTEGLIGAGFYAFSERGRARFDEFPDIIADDEFARRIARPSERGIASDETFIIRPPTTIRSLLNVMVRVRAGLQELEQKFPEMTENSGTSWKRSVRIVASRPLLWRHAPIYFGVMLVARARAARKLRTNRSTWERDETSRVAAPST